MASKAPFPFEKSPADAKQDKKLAGKKGAPKEGSAAEEAMDARLGQKTRMTPGKPAGTGKKPGKPGKKGK